MTDGTRYQSLPFCLFRIPKDGGRVLWQITNACNYRCSYCIFSSGKIGSEELTVSEAKTALRELKAGGYTHIKFTGGEPFLRPDFLEILETACENGFTCDVSTNASCITDKTAEKLSTLKLSMVHVGLDGPAKSVHEALRGNGTFEKTVSGIKNLVRRGVPVRIGCVIASTNHECLEEMTGFCRDLKVTEVIYSRMEPAGRLKADSPLLSNRPDKELRDEISIISKRYMGTIKVSANFKAEPAETGCRELCPGGKSFLYIDNLGCISACTWAVEKGITKRSIKSLKEETLSSILKEGPLSEFRCMVEDSALKEVRGCPARWR